MLDNLSTHTPAALYQAFTPAEARRVLRRLEFHYVPKHASWLNMVEIEIGVLWRSVSIGASPTYPRSITKSTRGPAPATRPVLASAGCLASSMPASRLVTPTRLSPAKRPPRESVKIPAMRY